MHDQKLTEDQHKSEMRRCAEDLRYFIRRGVEDNTKDTNAILNRSRFFGGVGEPDDGDNGRWMYDPFVRRVDTGAIVGTMIDDGINFIITVNTGPTIDHPYLLPPSSGRIEYLVPGGRCEHQANGTRLTMIWSCWDRENGRVPGLYEPLPPTKFSKPYWITF